MAATEGRASRPPLTPTPAKRTIRLAGKWALAGVRYSTLEDRTIVVLVKEGRNA